MGSQKFETKNSGHKSEHMSSYQSPASVPLFLLFRVNPAFYAAITFVAMNLDKQISHILMSNNCYTLEQVLYLSRNNMLHMKGMDIVLVRRTIKAVEDYIRSVGYSCLKDDIEIQNWDAEDINAERDAKLCVPLYNRFNVNPTWYSTVEIYQLPFNNHALSVLKRNGYETLGKLLCISETDILNLDWVGKSTLKNIVGSVRSYLSENSGQRGETPDKNMQSRQCGQTTGRGLPLSEEFKIMAARILKSEDYNALFYAENGAHTLPLPAKADTFVGTVNPEMSLSEMVSFSSLEPSLLRFRKFDRETVQRRLFLERLRGEIESLPANLQTRNVLPYLRYYAHANGVFEDIVSIMPENSSVRSFPDFLEERARFAFRIEEQINQERLSAFVSWLNYDISRMVQEVRATINCRGERGRYILARRTEHMTLREIGENLGIHKERVRVLETDITHFIFCAANNKTYDLLSLIHAEKGGCEILHISDLYEYMDEETARFLWYVISRKWEKFLEWTALRAYYHYSSDLDAVVFSHSGTDTL